ncbi:MAG TPA: type I glyceraldehyde-3-phosphate dehydrogenase [Flavobacterium sp.]|nr:type I glyceraldehyde-3-phosphate dehydrogenase [Flavobacterium sp.]
MKKIKIGINGFGRIGRLAFREAMDRTDIEVLAINDLMDVEQLAYLLKYDSVHGRWDQTVNIVGNHLEINGKTIRVTAEKDPAKLKWDEVGVDAVVDCTGIFKTRETAHAHIDAGGKKVVISAPTKDVPMYVMGVNHTEISTDENIISNASCTTNCLAPMVKVLNDNYGIKEALMTTVHAVTASQAVVDGASKKDYRGGRASMQNIIPASTGAAEAVTKVIPELDGKLTGMAFRVPVLSVSVVDLTVKLEKSTTYEHIMETFKQASENDFKGIIGFTNDAVVSQDFVSDTRISIIDAQAGIALNDTFFKIIGWYDNEYGYAAKLLDLTVYFCNR